MIPSVDYKEKLLDQFFYLLLSVDLGSNAIYILLVRLEVENMHKL